MLNIQNLTLGENTHRYHVFGSGKIGLVLEFGLGTALGEWWHVAEQLSARYTVLLYERSKSVSFVPSPQNVAEALHALLEKLPCEGKLILLGHSQGGLYAAQFAMLYPERVKGLVLLDPLSPNDSSYKTQLTPDEQKKSGFNKSENLVMLEKLARLHLGFIIKAVMRKAPPFYYYNGFSKGARNDILSSITDPQFIHAALEEYRLAHDDTLLSTLRTRSAYPNVPLVLLTHTEEFSVKETMEFGRTDEAFAKKVELIWQNLMHEYLSFFPNSTALQAKNSGHSIHLCEPTLLEEGLSRRGNLLKIHRRCL